MEFLSLEYFQGIKKIYIYINGIYYNKRCRSVHIYFWVWFLETFLFVREMCGVPFPPRPSC